MSSVLKKADKLNLSLSSYNGLAPTRRQAIMWTNDGIVYQCIYAHSASMSQYSWRPISHFAELIKFGDDWQIWWTGYLQQLVFELECDNIFMWLSHAIMWSLTASPLGTSIPTAEYLFGTNQTDIVWGLNNLGIIRSTHVKKTVYTHCATYSGVSSSWNSHVYLHYHDCFRPEGSLW